jgi:hypothetical protein
MIKIKYDIFEQALRIKYVKNGKQCFMFLMDIESKGDLDRSFLEYHALGKGPLVNALRYNEYKIKTLKESINFAKGQAERYKDQRMPGTWQHGTTDYYGKNIHKDTQLLHVHTERKEAIELLLSNGYEI